MQNDNTELTRELIFIKLKDYQNDGCTYKYNLSRQVEFKKGSKIMVQSCSLYNSTFNIMSQYGNNQMSITWLGQTINITIPDGYYSYDQINALIEYYLILNNWYWTTNNKAVYAINVLENTPRYKGQINIDLIPALSDATSAGYVKPSGATWSFPATATTPQLTMNAGLGKIFGFQANLTFPPTIQSSSYSYISDITPVVSPVYSYVMTCNLINSDLNPFNNNILGQIPLNNSFGGLVQYNSYANLPINIHPSKYNNIIIKFYDQDLNSIYLNDPEVTIILSIEYY